MSTPIRTNQLKIDLNADLMAKKYEVFKIETSERYFERGADILDKPSLCNNVCSVYFDSGKCFYVLMLKDISNRCRLRDALLQSSEGDSITLAEVAISVVDQRVIISLLLNALGSYELEFLRFNNLTGHLYCFNPKWIERDPRKGAALKIPCLELSVTSELRLALSVRTFTSELLKNKIVFKKRKFEQYPKYTLAANNTLRRRLNTDTDKCFIPRQTQGDKTSIAFMDIQNRESFEASKMGIVAQILPFFNEKYKGICNIQFQSIEHYVPIEIIKSLDARKKENKNAIRSLLEEEKIRVVDCIEDDYSSKFCKDVETFLHDEYGVKTTIGKRLTKNGLNLCLIHNAQYYSGKNDPHDKQYDGVAVQHITLEDFMGSAKAAISTVVHELLIKNDIERGRISLFDWTSMGFDSTIAFGLRENIGDEERYFFMTIKPDGTFKFDEQKFDLFSNKNYSDCMDIFTAGKDVAGVIRYANGDINIIKDTSWFTIPEVEQIHKELLQGNTFLRNKERRSELMPSITDIKLFEQDNCKYYFVGIVGNGMHTNVTHAANIRKIEPFQNSTLKFDDLLPLMNVVFVRNGQLTVLPFPFKYLREYTRLMK